MNLYHGKTLEEALNNAVEGENASLDVLTYSTSEVREGDTITGYTVLVFELRDVITFASSYLKKIIEGFKMEVEIKEAFKDGIIHLTIDSSHNSVLIGKNGKTLQAFNEIVRNAINYQFKKHYRILLDVGDYKDEKYEKLIRSAKRIAYEVKDSKGTMRLDPMPPDERRIVHNALGQFYFIETHSEGTGDKRHIVVSYKKPN